MSRISGSQLEKKRLKEITEHFTFLLSSLKRSQDIEKFLDEFLTDEEKVMLSKRLMLLMMIKREYTPSSIQSFLHVSYETVRSYQNQLKYKSANFKKTLEKMVIRERAEELFGKIERFIKPLGKVFSTSKPEKKKVVRKTKKNIA